MIQDIAPHVFNNQYKNKKPAPNNIVMYYQRDTVLMRRDEYGAPVFPRFCDLAEKNGLQEVSKWESAGDIYENSTYLFSVDDEEFFLIEQLPETMIIPEGFAMEKISDLVNRDDHYPQFVAVTGRQLCDWYMDRRYCGRCGRPLKKDLKERMLYCECGQIEYPKISPVVIVAVVNGGRLLLSRYAGRAYKKYSLIAGFCEIGEPVEDTVRREVMEEVGLRVKNIRFYKSQPWSFSNSVLMGFFCELDGSDKITVDTTELAEAEWILREEIPLEEQTGNSLTEEMIRLFQEGKDPFKQV